MSETLSEIGGTSGTSGTPPLPPRSKRAVDRARRAIPIGAISVDIVEELIDIIETRWQEDCKRYHADRERIRELENVVVRLGGGNDARGRALDRNIPQVMRQGGMVDQ